MLEDKRTKFNERKFINICDAIQTWEIQYIRMWNKINNSYSSEHKYFRAQRLAWTLLHLLTMYQNINRPPTTA